MIRPIESVAVLGAGTMGSGIAALCAQTGCRVLLLDVSTDAAERALARMVEGRAPMLDDPARAELITAGSFDRNLADAGACDWICEAIIEDLATKRALFERLEAVRRDGTIVSSNTSGIPLRAITEGLPERLRRAIAVTHFFNPVKVMKLVELVLGADTAPDVLATFEAFLGERLGKGVVHAKDTVNFIGNRIGCFWMLAGLHGAAPARAAGLTTERLDALLSAPLGIPATGLYGLIDLVGLDVLEFVARNLAANLPARDPGRAFVRLPAAEQAMLERGQVGRKAGGGFYRLRAQDDGSRKKETFDPSAGTWRDTAPIELAPEHRQAASLLFAGDAAGRFVWEVMGGTLCYAAGLIPEIADDVVNVDRAMRWGFNWENGPFELLDAVGPERVVARLEDERAPLPTMLQVLRDSGAERLYRDDGRAYLGLDGAFHPTP
ncbi:MAG TPA: 3-hydroxyacyl-CoA dehydrogenase family protein [Geminicoccaceae bacterium]|nr:3-hydroxyacyl-CoA dehydrogenase family protein [Geminicoccaceae bacterium]